MTSKILVADDSLTIQKVINITLGGLPYDLIESHSEEDLFAKLKEKSYELVLLDFNLSENKSGYELAKEIKSVSPSSSVMVMLGTFDNVDETAVLAAGIDDRIVKPFESSKFVEKCRTILEEKKESVSTPITFETAEPLASEDLLDNKVEESEDYHVEAEEKPAKGDGWGMRVPSVIEELDNGTLPDEGDLEYPQPIDAHTTSKMVSLNELKEVELETFDEDTDPNFMPPEDTGPSLEDELADDSDDLWAPDAEEPHLEFNSVAETSTQAPSQNIDISAYKSEILERLRDGVTPHLEKYVHEFNSNNVEGMVKNYLDQHFEEIMWKIVPDLAEKIIREEFDKIKNKILEDF